MTKQELKDIIKECFIEEGIVTEDVIYEGYEDDLAAFDEATLVCENMMAVLELDAQYADVVKKANAADAKKKELEDYMHRKLTGQIMDYKKDHGCTMAEAREAITGKSGLKTELVKDAVENAKADADKKGLTGKQKAILIAAVTAAAGVAAAAVIIKIKKEAAKEK